ncbi:hypothetical protein [Mariluticola halotolerans]|uniref:hypothetical protein n=1 Tax=Mariluticola halotolerans TaxID=2909283 RepID=UPI0026E1CCA1|nr:hypothetical protein [Mariluticola halotolerans]UJQ94688.1 hypothetical protein L1P08_01450 [Mariluticola halotolerans]
MSTAPDIFVTPEDLLVLEEILADPHCASLTIRQAIRAKIDTARVVPAADMPAETITLGSRVRFQVDHLPPVERILVRGAGVYPTGAAQCVTTPRGITLLGLAKGAQVEITDETGMETLHVLDVSYQPEAARRIANIVEFDKRFPPRPDWHRPAGAPARPAGAPFWDDDDPGPSAA